MAGMSDGVSQYWLMRSQGKDGLDIQGCSGAFEATWRAGVWLEGYSDGSEGRLRDAISEIERAVVELKARVVEDYDLEEY